MSEAMVLKSSYGVRASSVVSLVYDESTSGLPREYGLGRLGGCTEVCVSLSFLCLCVLIISSLFNMYIYVLKNCE